MKLSRIELDGAGSPTALVQRILELEPDLPIPVPIEALCERLDITSISEMQTEGFEAALVTDTVRSSGAILVAKGRTHRRRRFSIGHELAHFLIPSHFIPPDGLLQCTRDHLRLLDTKEQDRRARMEVEANRFSALLLMPPSLIRARLRQLREPQLADILKLADDFDVSKEAMARRVVDCSRHALAVIYLRDGRIDRFHRKDGHFPWIDIKRGTPVPPDSIWHDTPLGPGAISASEECEPETWLSATSARNVEVLVEQAMGQHDGHGMILLMAELRDEDEEDLEQVDLRWR